MRLSSEFRIQNVLILAIESYLNWNQVLSAQRSDDILNFYVLRETIHNLIALFPSTALDIGFGLVLLLPPRTDSIIGNGQQL